MAVNMIITCERCDEGRPESSSARPVHRLAVKWVMRVYLKQPEDETLCRNNRRSVYRHTRWMTWQWNKYFQMQLKRNYTEEEKKRSINLERVFWQPPASNGTLFSYQIREDGAPLPTFLAQNKNKSQVFCVHGSEFRQTYFKDKHHALLPTAPVVLHREVWISFP